MASIPSTIARVLFSSSDEADRFLPEGPRNVNVAGREALAWVNIQTAADSTRGDIHLRFWDNGEHRKLPQASRPGFLFPTDRPNVVLVGREKEIGAVDLLTNEWKSLARIPDDNPRTIINDGEIVPGGKSIVFGTKDQRFAEQIAALYQFSLSDKRLSVLADRQTCSNGKVFVLPHQNYLLLYDIDTPRRAVTLYELADETGEIQERGTALDLHGEEGFPDGMVDAGDGSVIIAFYNPAPVSAGRAVRFNLKTRERLEEWITPGSPRVTCPLLMQRDGKVQLILTTAIEGMPEEQRRQCPTAGNLFIADTTLASIPSPEYVRLS